METGLHPKANLPWAFPFQMASARGSIDHPQTRNLQHGKQCRNMNDGAGWSANEEEFDRLLKQLETVPKNRSGFCSNGTVTIFPF